MKTASLAPEAHRPTRENRGDATNTEKNVRRRASAPITFLRLLARLKHPRSLRRSAHLQSAFGSRGPKAGCKPALFASRLQRMRLWDAEGNASLPLLQYQLAGTTNWLDATIAKVDGVSWSWSLRATAPPGGFDHNLVWDAATDLTGASANVLLRVRARDLTLLGEWSEPMPYAVTILPDSDGDGLPDDWELEKLGGLGHTALDDTDQDGMNNGAEYLADTHPNDPNSLLSLRIEVWGGQAIVRWQSGVQATLYLQRGFSLDGNNVWQDVLTNPAPTAPTGSYIDLLGTNTVQFYRLRVER